MRIRTGGDLRAERARRKLQLRDVARRVGRTANRLGALEEENVVLPDELRNKLEAVFNDDDAQAVATNA